MEAMLPLHEGENGANLSCYLLHSSISFVGGCVTSFSLTLQTFNKDEPERYQSPFSEYIKRGIDTNSIEELYKKVHAAIRADPTQKKSEKQPPKEHKSCTFMSIIGGVIAGILGVTGWTGFFFYFLIMAMTSVGLAAKAGLLLYFGSWNIILLDDFFGGLMSFVLFWMYPW